MGTMSDAERDAFLSETRYAILTTLRRDGSPVSVPVWFDWDGEAVRMFTHEVTPKIRRVRNDAHASVLVANRIDEKEKWVAFDGDISVHDKGGMALAEKLAARYWEDTPDHAAALDSWRQMESGWRLLELRPAAIRTYVD
ncbi:MAG TPA: pyridoxamine 5'-phosphate oxidase family protein [Dehalococcoidia bacterium]|nr:pyridoxamine 5'-phosphate oxidase family protein [Dehalococcoidia bacterium]